MKLVVVCGSHNGGSQSAKVGRYCQAQIARAGYESILVDLAEQPLPLWQGAHHLQEAPWAQLAPQLAAAAGVVLITPEWDGMATPALKNFLVFAAEARVLNHKPALIVSVSNSDGGTYPVAELRMNSSKNSRLCFIPEHVIVRHVRALLNDHESAASDADQHIRRRFAHALAFLYEYAKALELVRASSAVDHRDFPYGM
jgi:NAD(P)H-dependent FMN reductase